MNLHRAKCRTSRGTSILFAVSLLLATGCSTGSLVGMQSAAPAMPATAGAVKVWVTTGDRHKLLAREADIALAKDDTVYGTASGAIIDVDPSVRYQEMVGFGVAMADASAWLLRNRMSPQQRADLMRELFGPSPGIGLNFLRLTIAGSDYSHTHYSYDDMPAGQTDPKLAHFSIAPNRDDVLPIIKEAQAINPGLRFMATPWSAPGWMKTTGSMIRGTLRPEAYGPYAQYLKRYLDAYRAEGVPIFALTIQNEPHFEPEHSPGMRLDDAQRATLVRDFVGPLLAQTHPETRILEWDHNWNEPDAPAAVLADAGAAKYISGVAWHCYEGSPDAQTKVHDRFPSKDTYFTECSEGEWATNWSDNLQWNVNKLIIGAVRNWARSVVLWTVALDENHGPHLGGCENCRGAVTIDSKTGAVTRNVQYYTLAHASGFVRPGARRIASNSIPGGAQTVAFRNADDGSIVLIAANPAGQQQEVTVRAGGRSFRYSLPAASVATLTWSGS